MGREGGIERGRGRERERESEEGRVFKTFL
jgi:hypothetical protein